MGAIVDIQLRRLKVLLDDRKITLDLDDGAIAWLGRAGYDPVYGARPLKRVIQRELQNPLAGAASSKAASGTATGCASPPGPDHLVLTDSGRWRPRPRPEARPDDACGSGSAVTGMSLTVCVWRHRYLPPRGGSVVWVSAAVLVLFFDIVGLMEGMRGRRLGFGGVVIEAFVVIMHSL